MAKMTKVLALVAHDNMKRDLAEWVDWNSRKLSRHHLVCTGTDTCRVRTFGTIDIRLHTDHSSRSVIHRAYRISHERQVDAILRLTASHLFHTSDPFIG